MEEVWKIIPIKDIKFLIFYFLWRCGLTRAMASSFLRFLDHTQWRITVGRTPLDEWSARRRDLYLTIHNIHNRQTSMPLAGFKPTISAGERPQTHALHRAATGTGIKFLIGIVFLYYGVLLRPSGHLLFNLWGGGRFYHKFRPITVPEVWPALF